MAPLPSPYGALTVFPEDVSNRKAALRLGGIEESPFRERRYGSRRMFRLEERKLFFFLESPLPPLRRRGALGPLSFLSLAVTCTYHSSLHPDVIEC